jgi:hypothetical protein
MKFGLLTLFDYYPEDCAPQEYYRCLLDEIAYAEELGFDSVMSKSVPTGSLRPKSRLAIRTTGFIPTWAVCRGKKCGPRYDDLPKR